MSAAKAASRSASDSICGDALAERAFNVATRLANELLDPDIIDAGNSSFANTTVKVSARGLGGNSGMALLFAAVAQATNEPAHHQALHAYIKRAAHAEAALETGLFSGLDGLLAAANYAILTEPRYAGLLDQCASALCGIAHGNIAPFGRATIMYDYDLIGGSAGKALASGTAIKSGQIHYDRTRKMCDHLTWLLADHARWRCPHPRIKDGSSWNDLGMAHGVAGMIAALSLVAPDEEHYLRAIRRASPMKQSGRPISDQPFRARFSTDFTALRRRLRRLRLLAA